LRRFINDAVLAEALARPFAGVAVTSDIDDMVALQKFRYIVA
jgi:hypothetical protein